MKYNIPKERVLSASHDDTGFDIAAGTPALDAICKSTTTSPQQEADSAEHCAFSSLMQLLRRSKRLTLEQLANDARVDLSELVSIEDDVTYEPRPRTVHQLAHFYNLPERKLLELSTLTTNYSQDLREAAVRFAANAKNVTDLSHEERLALNEFVKVLSSR